jgi:LPS-assembly protein
MKAVTLISLLSSLVLFPTVTAAQPKILENTGRICTAPQPTNPINLNKEDNQTDAERLGWVPLPSGSNLCNGLYENPILPDADKPLVEFDKNPVNLSFVDASFHNEGQSTATQVIVTQPQRLLTGDIAHLNRDPKTSEFDTIDLQGHVTLREPGKLIVGDSGKMNLQNREGDFLNVLYRLSLDPELSARPTLLETPTNSARTLTAQGRAERVHQIKPGLIEFDKATYSTCSPVETTWRLKAKHVTLDREVGRGVARHATIYVKNIPVFYTPYFSFPLDKRRKSGILFPTYGSTSLGGFSIQLPYYWNIAPNYDATIAPRWFSKRGVQINTEFRYLTSHSHGLIYINLLPNDKAFTEFQQSAPTKYKDAPLPPLYRDASLANLANASSNRGYLSWRNTTNFSPRWSSNIDYTRVTDDYYYRDFAPPRPLRINNQLLQQADIKYAGENWDFRGLLQAYQTLHPVTLSSVGKPYNMLPQVALSANYPNQKFGLTYQLENEYTHFTRGLNPGELATDTPPSGDRIHVQPGISLPIRSLPGFITPKLQLFMTGYRLKNQPANFGNQTFDDNINRVVPMFSLDTGLFFDREADFGNQSYQQTLEPRLFYLYVPYVNQTQIPIFDSAFSGFNYDLLFRSNRFNGFDRIGDAHQIAASLTTRFLDQETGAEKFRASIGQIYYFRDRKVSSCIPRAQDLIPTTTTPRCQDPGFGTSTYKTSPLAGQLSYNFNPLWNTTATITWDPNTRRTQNGNLNLQYRPGSNRLFNLGYNFLQFGDRYTAIPNNNTNLSQVMASFAFPVKDRWQAVGGWTYNVSHERSQNFFYGLEYNNCCVAAQLVMGRTFSGLSATTREPTYNKTIYFQIQLKGFGNFGTVNPLSVLGTIPGYQDRFGRL